MKLNSNIWSLEIDYISEQQWVCTGTLEKELSHQVLLDTQSLRLIEGQVLLYKVLLSLRKIVDKTTSSVDPVPFVKFSKKIGNT